MRIIPNLSGFIVIEPVRQRSFTFDVIAVKIVVRVVLNQIPNQNLAFAISCA